MCSVIKLYFSTCILLFYLLLYTEIKAQTILNKDTVYTLSKSANDSISIHYIGCSGFFIRKGNDVVLIDPYFSNNKANTYLFGTLTNKSNISADVKYLIDSVFSHAIGDSTDRSGLIKTLLITHGHVDHYGDIPYLFQSGHFNMDTIKIIGNSTVQHYLAGDNIPDRNIIKPVESSASTTTNEGKWIYVNKKIRIMPVIDEHAPHLRIAGIKINFASQKNEKKDIHHKYWRQYSSGQTICYLIDFLNDDGNINFRAYINSSACGFPHGCAAQSILNEHPIDIASMCVASFNNVKNYPEDIVRYLKPKHIIVCHWENFLSFSINELKNKPKTVSLTNVNKFFKRLDQALSDLNSGTTYIRPNVNTTVKYFYSTAKSK